jgi:hypothetical protein
VLGAIVVLGIGSGAAYFQYEAPRAAAAVDREVAAVPTSPEARLALWHEYGAPQFHHRLSTFARFSPESPWLVTHAVRAADGGDPELWGIDCSRIPESFSRVEGMTVVLELPEPRCLGRAPLRGDQASVVPLYDAGAALPDARERLRDLALHFLDRLPAAMAKGVPGASLEIRIVPAASAAADAPVAPVIE